MAGLLRCNPFLGHAQEFVSKVASFLFGRDQVKLLGCPGKKRRFCVEKAKVKTWRTFYSFLALGLCLCFGSPAVAASTIDLSNGTKVKQILYAQLQEWRNVRHRVGGLSKKGIDCSGFVHLTFLNRFGIELPRSTKQLAKIGTEISRDELRSGDLVFFKTGCGGQHVGIYVEEGKFVHVSTKKGVMMSSLDDIYWSQTYWKSIRLASSGEII